MSKSPEFENNIEEPATISNQKEKLTDTTEHAIDEKIEKASLDVERMLATLRSKIEACEYDVVIGDDASGRIYTLMVRELMSEIYRRQGKTFETRFMTGGRIIHSHREKRNLEHEDEMELKKSENDSSYIHSLKEKLHPHRALIITDIINTGDGLRNMISALHTESIPFDLCAVNVVLTDFESTIGSLEESLGVSIHYTHTHHGIIGDPGLYQNYAIGGVIKDPLHPEKTHASRFTDVAPNLTEKEVEDLFGSQTQDKYQFSNSPKEDPVHLQMKFAREKVKIHMAEVLNRWDIKTE